MSEKLKMFGIFIEQRVIIKDYNILCGVKLRMDVQYFNTKYIWIIWVFRQYNMNKNDKMYN